MLAYTLSKTATHAISLNLAQREERPKDSTVVTILPFILFLLKERHWIPLKIEWLCQILISQNGLSLYK